MKRFFAIFSLCAVLALSGCKKDDPAITDGTEFTFSNGFIATGTGDKATYTYAEAAEETQLTVTAGTSLDDLKYFPALTSLSISGVSGVEALDLSSLSLTDLSVTGIETLASVTLKDGAAFTSLKFEGCAALTTLDLSNIGALPAVENFVANSVTSLTISEAQNSVMVSDDSYDEYSAKLAEDAKIYEAGNEIAVYAKYGDSNIEIRAAITGFTLDDVEQTDTDLITNRTVSKITALTLTNGLTDEYFEKVFVDFESLTSLTVVDNGSVETIDMSATNITSVELDNLGPHFESLTLADGADIEKLMIKGNGYAALTTLDLSNIGALPAVENFVANSVTSLTISEAQNSVMVSDDSYDEYSAKLAEDAKIYEAGNETALYPYAKYEDDNFIIVSAITAFTLNDVVETDTDLITTKTVSKITAVTMSKPITYEFVETVFVDFEALTSFNIDNNANITVIDMSATNITSVEIGMGYGLAKLESLTLADGAEIEKLMIGANSNAKLTTLDLTNVASLPAVENFEAPGVTELKITAAQEAAMGDIDAYKAKLANGAKIIVSI